LTGKTGALEEWVRNAKHQRKKKSTVLYFQKRLIMNKMMKEEIEEDKIDIETPFLLITDNSPEELNERLDILL